MRKTTKAKRPPRSEAEHPGQYVYGIVRNTGSLRLGVTGIGAERAAIKLVSYRDLAAVVSATPLVTLEPTRENVLAHEAVNQRVIRSHAFVPMSFGTVFKSRADVLHLLRSAYEAFSQALNTIADNVELGLEVFWDVEKQKRTLDREVEAIRACRQAIAASGADNFAARMEYGGRMEAALEGRAGEYATAILAGLRSVSVASKVSPTTNERMVLKAAFLVARGQRAAFEQQLRAIDARRRDLTFRLTGPWPPYNFVSIRLQIGEEGAP